MKTCSSCRKDETQASFYVKGTYCKPCASRKSYEWYLGHKQRKADINRAWRQRHYPRRHIMQIASNILWKAIHTGKLQRGKLCEVCNTTSGIEAAHSDYTQPLNVRWLCRSCHRLWDQNKPKSIENIV